MPDISLDAVIVVFAAVAGLLLMIRGFAMPASFGNNEEEREKMRKRMMEIEDAQDQRASVVPDDKEEADNVGA